MAEEKAEADIGADDEEVGDDQWGYHEHVEEFEDKDNGLSITKTTKDERQGDEAYLDTFYVIRGPAGCQLTLLVNGSICRVVSFYEDEQDAREAHHVRDPRVGPHQRRENVRFKLLMRWASSHLDGRVVNFVVGDEPAQYTTRAEIAQLCG